MREKFDNFVSTMMILFTLCWPLFFLVPMFYDSVNTTTEIYTTTCEVTDKHEDEESTLNVSVSTLLKMPIMNSETIYIVVVEYEGNLYEIEVDKNMYDEIIIGELVECEVKYTHNEHSQEENYEVSKLKEN